MIALVQRVSQARVDINQCTVGSIENGLLVLLGVEKHDSIEIAQKLAHKVCHYRIFNDELGKMNLNVQQAFGKVLVVSQFTLAADTQSGNRPSFSAGATPDLAKSLYEIFCQSTQNWVDTQTGQFGADMQVSLCNDGPVTFWLKI